MPDLLHDYQYLCGVGHYVGSAKPQTKCLVARCPEPTLTRVGKGSQGPRAQTPKEG